MTSYDNRFRRPGLRVLGVVAVLCVALFLTFTVAVYRGVFATDALVTLRTDRVGNQLRELADVKVRGLVVGQVRTVSAHGADAELTLALDPDQLDLVPRNVTARLLPTTVFGKRYVSLVPPRSPDPEPLSDGDVISQDRSPAAIEIERVLNNLMPLLRSVKPAELSETLNALAQALEGRGEQLGDTLVQIGDYIGELNPRLPDVKADITALADLSETYDTAAEDFLGALSDLTVTSRTVVDQRANLDALYAELTTSATDVAAFFHDNAQSIITLADSARPTLSVLARYAPQYACMLTAVSDLKPRLENVFGADGQPGMHVELTFSVPRGEYRPGVDDPRYDEKPGPRCYGDTSSSPAALTGLDDGLGPANSPQEAEFLGVLLGPELGVAPEQVPNWSGLLVGPLLRGAEVSFE
jgi:phospholipid/cholesterol/gamma-HCH transport system substrate-binding protein